MNLSSLINNYLSLLASTNFGIVCKSRGCITICWVNSIKCDIPDFKTKPWSNAVLVTPRHAVRTRWNTAVLQKYCIESNRQLYLSPSEDMTGTERHLLTMEEHMLVSGMKPQNMKRLEKKGRNGNRNEGNGHNKHRNQSRSCKWNAG